MLENYSLVLTACFGKKKEKQYDALFASLISMAFYLAGRIDFQLLKT